jgi:hypothetical protein
VLIVYFCFDSLQARSAGLIFTYSSFLHSFLLSQASHYLISRSSVLKRKQEKIVIMKISSCLFALSLCFSVLAAPAEHEEHAASANKTKSTGHNSVKAACAQMQELTMLTKLAANQTLLEDLVTKKKLNASEASALETKAASASSQLSTLANNATLVSQCAVVDAHESLVVQCDQMTRLEQWEKLASNTTALDELATKRNLTQAAISKLQEQAANASTVLKTMESNATLVTSCQQLQAKKSNNTG